MHETPNARQVFNDYFVMGPGHSLKKLAQP